MTEILFARQDDLEGRYEGMEELLAQAEDAKDAAVVAQGAAETAQTGAEAGQAGAEAAQAEAETAQAGAETAQGLAETAQAGAETAQTGAENAQAGAEAALDAFTDIYLGDHATDPTTDNDGNALVEGQFYWNTALKALKFYDGASWASYDPNVGLEAVVDDTTPQLGGDLDLNGHEITGMVIGTDIQAYDATLLNAADIGVSVEAYDATILKSADIGTTVQGYDADTLKADTSDNLTAGFTATSYPAGVKTTGTFTPSPANGNFQHATNGGAHTLAPPSDPCTMVLEYLNNSSAGTVTTSGFTKVTGDAIATTNAYKFIFFITVTDNYSLLHVQALQ